MRSVLILLAIVTILAVCSLSYAGCENGQCSPIRNHSILRVQVSADIADTAAKRPDVRVVDRHRRPVAKLVRLLAR